MTTTKFAASPLALAIALAFPVSAYADSPEQSMPEVLVTASKAQLNRASVAGFSDTPLLETPASVNVISAQQMQDLQIHSTTDAARYDASLSDAYNAVGYAEQFSIRGFKLDNATSYRKDGMAIPGDTQIPLENKERIEVLKGLSGLQAGVSAPGGMINYVTKRPTEQTLRTVILEERERGNLYGTVDLGGRFEDARFGYRVNLAAERLRSYIKGADGNRKFAAAAFDWRSRRRPCCRSMATSRKSASNRTGLPAAQQHHPAGGGGRHHAEQAAMEPSGGNHQQQSGRALCLQLLARVECQHQRQPAPVQA
jgi:iron complex outermembrane receptor protein